MFVWRFGDDGERNFQQHTKQIFNNKKGNVFIKYEKSFNDFLSTHKMNSKYISFGASILNKHFCSVRECAGVLKSISVDAVCLDLQEMEGCAKTLTNTLNWQYKLCLDTSLFFFLFFLPFIAFKWILEA